MSQALVKTNQPQSGLALVKSYSTKMNMAELKEMAEMYFQSGSFPDLKNAAQAMVKIKAGEDLGFSPHVAIAGIHFFQGRAVIGAGLLASLIKDSGKYEYKVLQHDTKVCSIQMMQIYNGQWAKMGVPVTYTIQDAQAAGLTSKDVWKKFPADMLFAAVIRQACRRYCADVLRGTPVAQGYDSAESNFDAQQIEAGESIQPESNEAVIDAEPVESVEDDLTDLRTSINDLISEKIGDEVDPVEAYLKGRDISEMSKSALIKMHEELLAK